ncbi:MAG: hypothetical protein GSR84_04430 [Desulfurococcales archaeon]|nr:hypothetical protein [Desulfurococcales archaeon]
MIRETVEELGECPRCGGIARYIYDIEALKSNLENVNIRARIECDLCGFRDDKRIIIPLKALIVIKYLLNPEARLIAEKIRLLTQIRTA